MQRAALEETRSACPQCGYLAQPAAGAVNFCPKCGRDLRAAPGDRTLTNTWLNQVIADRYRLLALLGEGGMGAVYKAEHIRMGKALALKVLRGEFAREPGAVARFRAEAQIVSRLSHPHTIAVFDFGEIGEPEGFYLAMEYVPGKDLAHVLREEGRIPEGRAAEIGQQILGSLAEAHDAGIVHRDMKPGNAMLMKTRSGEDFVKVLDFGIAKLRDEREATTTSAGAIVGTPNYLSPEQARGDAPDARADLYSLGCVLYELVAGRPPFVAPSPLAVVSAHLNHAPPPLAEVAPGVSQGYAAVVHRALAKKPADRFESADEMRDALLRLGEPSRPRREHPTVPELTGELQIANRDDFADFERQLRALKRARIAAPLAVAFLLAMGGLVFWRWPDVYGFLDDRYPAVAAALPASFRPADLYDGTEHEPNDSPAQANRLPIPPGPDGRRGGGTAVMRGHIGAKLNETTGDVDVFRVDVPRTGGRSVLVAEWSGEKEGEGIRGLDVALTLNRQRPGTDVRSSAPLVANVDRGGPGRPETLAAAVEPGTYYLAVRERHRDDTGPVEKPTDWYVLSVRLTAPRPGEEIEPNDAPDSVEHRELRYPEWRSVAERNPLGEGTVVHGTTSREDPDNYAVAPHGPAEAPELIAVVPEPGLAIGAQLWVPDDLDLAPGKLKDRVRFERAGETPPGQVLFVRLHSVPRAGAPDLVQLRATSGEGGYQIAALGQASTSGAAVVSLIKELAAAGHASQALELAAGFVKHLPGSSARAEVLLSAGQVAERVAGTLRPNEVGRFQRASQLLGAEIFGPSGGSVRYLGAFDAAVAGSDRLAEQAAVRLVPRTAPCTPEDVALRAVAFLEKYPSSPYTQEARLWQARALEDRFWRGGGRDRRLLDRAVSAYRSATQIEGDGTAEAEDRIRKLGGRRPTRTGATRVCR